VMASCRRASARRPASSGRRVAASTGTRAGNTGIREDEGVPAGAAAAVAAELTSGSSQKGVRGRSSLGSIGFGPMRISKCRCGPVVRPVEPTVAMGLPGSTRSPFPTRSSLAWA
jgi:hypothetical protein